MTLNVAAMYFKATSRTADRTLGDRFSDVFNVKDYVCNDGLPVQGNGVHDDTTGIQAAVNAALASANGGTIYLPPGLYIITATITFVTSTGLGTIRLIGAGRSGQNNSAGTVIQGNVNGFLVQKSDFTGGIQQGQTLTEVRHIGFNNTCSLITNAAGGGCLQLSGTVGAVIQDCFFTPPGGANRCFGLLVDAPPNNLAQGDGNNYRVSDCVFEGGYHGAGATRDIGCQIGGIGMVENCWFQSLWIGLEVSGTIVFPIIGCHFEPCGTGLNLGFASDGSPSSCSVSVIGCSWESNDTALGCHIVGGMIANCLVQAFAGAGTGGANPQYGFNFSAVTGLTVISCNVAGWFDQYAIVVPNPTSQIDHKALNATFIETVAANTEFASQDWQMPTIPFAAQWIQGCNNPTPIYSYANQPINVSAQPRNVIEGDRYIFSDISIAPAGNFAATNFTRSAGSPHHAMLQAVHVGQTSAAKIDNGSGGNGNTLTITGTPTETIVLGTVISFSSGGVPTLYVVSAFLSGTGGTGTYTVTDINGGAVSTTIASTGPWFFNAWEIVG